MQLKWLSCTILNPVELIAGLWHFTHQKDQEHTRSVGGLFKIDPVEARKHAVMEIAVKTAVHSIGEHKEWSMDFGKAQWYKRN